MRLILLLALLLVGCVSCGFIRDEQSHAATQVARSFTVRGTASVPIARADGTSVPVAVGIDLAIKGGGTDETTAEARGKTQLDAPELAGAVVAAFRQAFPAIGAVMSAFPAPAKTPWYEDPATVTAIGTSAFALERTVAAHRNKTKAGKAA